ncbi:PAS domain S-box protein [Oculatella sp. LEGE 06141]|uniref:PAS domain S-box protein n=1 Tax=Oculatella sp. LEGE 06141 TaxID=1828648 RepID=UPI00187F9288|nr:PAS domain S-box protein [Oculatella sp. LEGE 06141]MBE9182646.1 PAS domain S-box protein [Oculatella sp. LEGE 06141]
MTANSFIHQLESLYLRVSDLYHVANVTSPPKQELLPAALKELGTVSEELQVAVEILHQQNEELVATRTRVEAERQHYQDLFEFAPDAFIATDSMGVIYQANRAALKLLNIPREFLLGKPLAVFVHETDRQPFRSHLSRLSQGKQQHTLELQLWRATGEARRAVLTAVPIPNATSGTVSLGWSIHDITSQKQAEAILSDDQPFLGQDGSVHVFTKGELIPLQPQAVCWVCDGWVGLNTLSETGKEVFVGLVGASMPFGSPFTALSIYQAIALSTVQLAYIPLKDITSSPDFTRKLFEKVAKRLQQTELLLSISGQQRVRDRLWGLLMFLKQEVGQPMAGGTQLSIRFTHEELASACCTTRVTITRLLNQFVQEGCIRFNADHHIILM